MSVVLGFVGPGNMGAPMIQRLLRADYVVHVWARVPSKCAALVAEGAVLAESLIDLCQSAEVILTCLANAGVARQIYLDPGGLVDGAKPGQVLVDHTTCEPEAAVEFARVLEQQGAFFVDAPVSGGPTRAADGSLVAMAGGRAEIVEKVAPILAAYAAAVHNCGEVGRGQTLKLVNQYLVIIHAVAAAEAASLVEAAGIDATTARDALMSGWAASAMLDLVLPPALAREFASRGAPLGPLSDIAAMVATAADRARIRSTLLPAASSVLGRAVEKGFADAGFSALIEAVEHQT